MALLALVSGAASCDSEGRVSDAGFGDGAIARCGAGLTPYKTACLPRLDDCPGNQVPVPGGGCKRIGVEECTPSTGGVGIKAPPDWTCKPIGVEACVPAGGGSGIKGPPDWTCKSIGQPSCVTGWKRVAGGWCEPTLPSAKCAAGYLEVIGKTTCQEVGDCGSGTWGKIKLGKETIFVDGSYLGGGSEGTQAKPFTSIAAALAAAPEHGHVAVAAGTYVGDLVIDRPLTLEGPCPRLVTVKGVKENVYPFVEAAILVSARDVVLRGLRVTGPASGVIVDAGEATLDQVVLEGTGVQGLFAWNGAKAALRDSLVANARFGGVDTVASTLLVERSVVRDSRADMTMGKPHGFGVRAVGLDGKPSALTVRDSVVIGNLYTGVLVQSAVALIERTTVRATRAFLPHGEGGEGMAVLTLKGELPASLVLRDSEVAGNHTAATALFGATATVERSAARDTRSRPADKTSGAGISANSFEGRASTLSLRDSIISGNRGLGILASGSSVTADRTVVESTLEQESDQRWGVGVLARDRSTLLLRDSRIARNRTFGVWALGATATIERAVIEHTLSQAAAAQHRQGNGIEVSDPLGEGAALVLRDSLIRRNRNAGVRDDNGRVAIERTVVRDTEPDEADNCCGWGIFGIGTARSSSAQLAVRDSLIAHNTGAGVGAYAPFTLERTIVKDTRVAANDQRWGNGLEASPAAGASSPVVVRDCLFERNHSFGLSFFSSALTMERTVIQGTLPNEDKDRSHPRFGVGLVGAPSNQGGGTQPTLLARDCLLVGNRMAGVMLAGVKASIERSAIKDTLPAEDGTAGIGLSVELAHGAASLTVRDTLLAGNRGQSLLLASSVGALERVVIRRTRPDQAKGYGDAIQATVSPSAKGTPTSLTLRDSVVEGSTRAHLLFEASGGMVERSVLRRGVFSVALEKNASPTIAPSNVLEGNTENRITYGEGLKPAPPPKLPPAPSLPSP